MLTKIGKYLYLELSLWGGALLRAIPGLTGCMLRRLIFAKGRRGVMIWEGVVIEGKDKLSIDKGTSINRRCIINAKGGVSIGKDVLIGPGVIIYSQNHNFRDTDSCITSQGYEKKAVTIEDDVWIGAGVKIMPGVKIEKGAVIGAGSVVTKNIGSNKVYAGVPAIFKCNRG